MLAPAGSSRGTHPNAFLTPTLDFVASVACCVGFKAATTILGDEFSQNAPIWTLIKTYFRQILVVLLRLFCTECLCGRVSILMPAIADVRTCAHGAGVFISACHCVLLVCATACACLRAWSLSCLLVYFLACSLACLLACFLAGGRARNSCVPSCLTHSHACLHVSPITYVRTWFLAQSCM